MSHSMIPGDVRKLSRERALLFYQQISSPAPESIERGQIWSTFSQITLSDGSSFQTDDPRIVLTLAAGGTSYDLPGQVIVAPISIHTSMATELDLICRRGTSPLDYDFIIEIWNETPALRQQLRRYLGRLDEPATAALQELYVCHLTEQPVPASLLGWVGPRLMGEQDPRYAFQESEVEAVAYLGEAATTALSLEEEAADSVSLTNQIAEQIRFATQPVFRRLADVLHQPKTAYASSLETEKTWVVNVVGGGNFLTFELLNERVAPYEIYLIVHEASPSLLGRQVSIALQTLTSTFQSASNGLQIGNEIIIGNDELFRPEQVRSIEITIS